MGELFKGWRRKAGCVALVVALVFMAGWLRSQLVFDSFNAHFGRNYFGLESKRSTLCFTWSCSDDVWDLPFWSTLDASTKGTELHGFASIWEWQSGELGYVDIRDDDSGFIAAIGPYWSITVPLTLLSAYLILWKPRKNP